MWRDGLLKSRPKTAPERWTGPSGESKAETELSWKEPLSQRFHKLSKHALDEIIETLLKFPLEHGVATKWTLTDGQMQRLCSAARRQFLHEDSLLRIGPGTVIAGDLHGDFRDLKRIFDEFGHPSKRGANYLFLGDYVDRGVNGLNVITLLLAYKLRYPNKVFLVRGNHESLMVTLMYGFFAECLEKSSRETWLRICNVFDCLPAAALVGDQLFCIHGGLSPKLQRPEDVSSISRPCKVETGGDGLLMDLAWSDPNPNVTGWVPNRRGKGFYFGMDEAHRFVEANGLRAIVRAHEFAAHGYNMDGDVITVFSAADYRDRGNDASVLVVKDDMSCFLRIFPSLAPKEELAPEAQLSDEDADDDGEEELANLPDWGNARLAAVLQAATASEMAHEAKLKSSQNSSFRSTSMGSLSFGSLNSASPSASGRQSIDSTYSVRTSGARSMDSNYSIGTSGAHSMDSALSGLSTVEEEGVRRGFANVATDVFALAAPLQPVSARV